MPNPQELKTRLQQFVERDIEEEDDIVSATQTLLAFGDVRNDLLAAKQLVRFLLDGIRRTAWTWSSLGCTPPGPYKAIPAIEFWLEHGTFDDSLASALIPEQPIRDGAPVADCDKPALTDLAAAASRLAYFCCTRHITDAAMVLCSLHWGALEGLQGDDEMEFEEWMVQWPKATGEGNRE